MKKTFTMMLGFTMAEILLSLTIIGVVAAITLPSLTGNINERTWNTQRKALYARFSQAIALMPSLNGYGTLKEESSAGAGDGVDNAAETFISGGLSKVLKINNICDNDHLEDCGIVSKFTNLAGSQKTMPLTLSELHSTLTNRAAYNINGASYPAFSQPDVKAAAFETANGESIALYYNPTCISSLGEQGSSLVMQRKMCLNLIYDLNGNKGPNTVGKDIGVMAVFYPSDSLVVAAMPSVQDAAGGSSVTSSEASKACTAMGEDYRLPNREELVTIYINTNLFGRTSGRYWSSTRTAPNGYAVQWQVGLDTGILGWDATSSTSYKWKVLCVKRS